MISLLLTLFISLFSFGSSINTIVEPIENNIIFNDSKPIHNVVLVENSYVDYTPTELCTEVVFNKTLEVYNAYVEEPINSTQWKYIDNCICQVFDIDDMSTQLNDNYNSLLACYIPSGDFSFLGTMFYSDISNGARTYYGWTLMRGVNGSGFNYVSWGWSFVSTNTNPYSISTGVIYSAVNKDIVLRFPYYTLQSTDFTIYNPLYQTYVNNSVYYDNESTAYIQGYDNGYKVGYDEGNTSGYQTGYDDGLVHADYDSTALTIFTGVTEIGLLPVNVFLRIFEFEVFGINISGLVGGLLTIAVVVIIIRFLLGEKDK